MSEMTAIVLFRRDLRLGDNPAFAAAAASGAAIIPLFVLDDSGRAPGGASRWWLEKSLEAIGAALGRRGLTLILRKGDATSAVESVVRESGAQSITWNRRYAPDEVAADAALKKSLTAAGIAASSFNANLVREPWEVRTRGAGGSFKVFTPFWRQLRALGPGEPAPPIVAKRLRAPQKALACDRLESWRLAPTNPDWAREFGLVWTPGEAGASAALERFIAGPVRSYGEQRNRPDVSGTSRLSPHLAFGEISPAAIWRTVAARMEAGDIDAGEGEKFLSEIAWREFSYHILYHQADLAREPMRSEFQAFPWAEDRAGYRAWTKGLTGYPIVDAGMRELWRTGWMHNRVRMIAASFLIKDLLIDWREGEAWFWDTLVDADPANNPASWQWVAGSGADAAPYFRIFNPVTQGEKFDPDGDYVRRFVPELAPLPAAHIHQPWTAPESVLRKAGVSLGVDYPLPILDHANARNRALAAYASIRKGAAA